MKRYIEQLLEDIEVSQNRALECIKAYSETNTEQGFDDFVEPNPEDGIKLSDLMNIETILLPHESLIDEEDVKILSLSIIQMWRAYGLYPVFSPHLPRRIKYSLLRDYWDQIVFPSNNSRVDIELCDHATCPYCDLCPVCETKTKTVDQEI